jgi:RNA polymerase sigma-70 factor (ECF subfamily)
MTDSEAIAQMQRGDIDGLEPLVRRYQVAAVRAAYLITRDRALAEDVAQAAFLRAYERIGQFDPARPFGPWFLRSVVNDALKVAARRERTVPWVDAVAPLPGPSLDEVLQTAETNAVVWAALGGLPPAQRTAIVLRYYLDLSEAEMADRLGVPPGTVKSRLHAARTRLRRLLPAWLAPKGDLL